VQGPHALPFSRRFATFARSSASSLAAVALEALLLTLLVSGLHIHYLVASAIGTLAYFAASFTLHRIWTFRGAKGQIRWQLARYALVAGIGSGLGIGLIALLVGKAQLPYLVGWAMAGLMVFTGWTHPMNRRFAFRAKLLAEPQWAPLGKS
jgi:putative flippase GtrA